MKNLRLYSKLPMSHNDFTIEYWRPAWGTTLPLGDFMVRDYGGKVCDMHQATTTAWFIITGDVREIFEKINWALLLNAVSIKPTLTIPYLILGYELTKQSKLKHST